MRQLVLSILLLCWGPVQCAVADALIHELEHAFTFDQERKEFHAQYEWELGRA
jgi:hypothetical protein